jgi:hypothetical protein
VPASSVVIVSGESAVSVGIWIGKTSQRWKWEKCLKRHTQVEVVRVGSMIVSSLVPVGANSPSVPVNVELSPCAIAVELSPDKVAVGSPRASEVLVVAEEMSRKLEVRLSVLEAELSEGEVELEDDELPRDPPAVIVGRSLIVEFVVSPAVVSLLLVFFLYCQGRGVSKMALRVRLPEHSRQRR